MKHYHAKDLEMTKEGFTDLFILNTSNLGSNSQAAAATPTNDFSVGFSSQNINLTALNAKDVVLDAMIDINTNIVGPTGAPTAQVKTSSGGVAITNTVNVLTGSGALRDNTVVGAANSAGNEYLVLALAAGGGNGAAATAGEIWVWANISRNDRLKIQV